MVSCPRDHLLYFQIRVDWNQLDFRVLQGEDLENFIRKFRPDALHFLEVEKNHLKLFRMFQQSLGL